MVDKTEKITQEVSELIEKVSKKKDINLKIASLVNEFDVNLAHKISECGTYISFKQNIHTDKVTIDKANFCKARICPICAWRSSLKEYSYMKQTVSLLEAQAKAKNIKYNYLFLTLTLKNCSNIELDDTITTLTTGFKHLLRKKKVKSIARGYYRNIEITYNKRVDTYHPHIHAILVVPSTYFKKEYITKAEWQGLWKDVLKVDYIPQIDIQRVDMASNDNAVAELSKYTVKFKNLLTNNYYKNIEVVETLHYSMLSRRLKSYGGVIRQVRKHIKTDISDYELKEDNTVYLPSDYIKYNLIFSNQGYTLKKI